jgi:hypothetical protein
MPRMLQSRRNTGLFRAIPDLADGTKDTKGEK